MFKYKTHKLNIKDCSWARKLCSITKEEADKILDLSPYVEREDPILPVALLPENGICLTDMRNGCAFMVVHQEDYFSLYTADVDIAYRTLELTRE